MKLVAARQLLLAFIVLSNGILNLWAGISLLLLLLFARKFGAKLLTHTTADFHSQEQHEERLIIALRRLRTSPHEGEIFGYNSSIRSEVHEALLSLKDVKRSGKREHDWVDALPIILTGLQSMVVLAITTIASAEFQPGKIIALLILNMAAFAFLSTDHPSRSVLT